jgi:hypothetical protein
MRKTYNRSHIFLAAHFDTCRAMCKLIPRSDLTNRIRTVRGQATDSRRSGPFSVHICRTRSDGQLSDRSVGCEPRSGSVRVRSVRSERGISVHKRFR